MEKFLFENDVESMRARDLRNLLIQKLGVDSALIAKIIDREELKKMVVNIVYEQLRKKTHENYIALAYKATIVVGVLTVVFLSRNIIWGCMVSVSDMLGESSYKTAKKSKLLIYNIKRRKFVAAFALLVSLLLELAVAWIQISVLLSWVIARDSILRRFMLPTLSFPVSANTIASVASGRGVSKPQSSDGSIGGTIGSYSLDVGPMLTIMAVNFLINKLNNFAAGIVLEHKRNKEEKRTRRFYEAHPAAEGAPAGDGEGEGAAAAVDPLLHKARSSAAKSDAESIDDSLHAFFGRRQPPAPVPGPGPSRQPAEGGSGSLPVHESAGIDSHGTEGTDGAVEGEEGKEGTQQGAGGGAGGGDREDGWLD